MSVHPDQLVRCTDVARTYGSGRAAVVAVHGVSCEVNAGEGIAIVGPSGSGKSTLLHLMAGLDDPTTGAISWPALGDRSALRPRLVGVVFQGPSLLAPLDVEENVALPLVLGGTDPEPAADAARIALASLGLDDVAGSLPEELSGGQAQRAAVARVLAARPRLILADEPTGQLDHVTGARVMDALLATASETGAALVVSTHDAAVAERLGQQWQIADGKLIGVDRQEASCSA
jgi:putative ABC transport system ATP-binding protein